MPRRPRPHAFLIALVALLAPASLSAQFPFTEKVAPEGMDPVEQFKFISGSGVGGFGVQVGPYTGQMTSYPGNPLITIYCVDYLHGISTNTTWSANVSRLNVADIGDTRLGIAGDDSSALSRYRKAAWLASQFTSNQTTASWRQIHSAIWTIVIAGDDPTKQYYNQYGSWIKLANDAEASGYAGFDFREWAVLTDVRSGQPGSDVAVGLQPGVQEYLVRMTVTPEPETIIMLLSGMLILALVWRRGVIG
jgi:hypothetical protein